MGVKIRHKPLFNFNLGSVSLKNAAMDFEDHFQIKSGTAKVSYPLSVIFRKTFPLSIHAENLVVEPSTELKSVLGDQQIVFETVSAKFIIQPKRQVVIEFLDAESKTVQFHLGAKDLDETR